MSKQTGLGARLLVGGFNVSGDIGELGAIGGGPEPLVVTGIDKSAIERIGGRRDGRMDFNSFFNDATGQEHAALKTLPTTDVAATYMHRNAQGSPAASIVAKQVNYDGTRATDGMFTFAVNEVGNGFGLEWGEVVTPNGIANMTGAGTLAGYDYGASVGTTNFGGQAYLHVVGFTGTDATINIQHSTDNAVGDPYATLMSFSTITGVGWQRIATATPTTAVERWIRVAVLPGTFSSMDLVVVFVRNLTATVF